jgi:hypothetical protein
MRRVIGETDGLLSMFTTATCHPTRMQDGPERDAAQASLASAVQCHLDLLDELSRG